MTEQDNRKKAFPIYKQQLAGYLMMRGFRLMDIQENRDNPRWNVFYFMGSPEIQLAIENYTKSRI